MLNAFDPTEPDFRQIVESQRELVYAVTPDGLLRYANPALGCFLGQDPRMLKGQSILPFVPEEDHPAITALWRQAAEEGQARPQSHRIIGHDGRRCWVEWSCHAPPAPDGKPGMVHAVGRDLTEQQRAAKALADTEARQQKLYEATPIMMHSIDSLGRLTHVSDTWLRTLGYERHEVLGRASVDFLTPNSRERALHTVMPLFFQQGRCDNVDYQMVRKNGSTLHVKMSATLERDAQGRPLRSMAVIQDVTDSKATADALKETTHMLRLVLDSLPARISYWDDHDRNRFANKAFLEVFGVEQASITGRHVSKVLGESWYQRVRSHIDRTKVGETVQLETTMLGPQGDLRYMDMRFTPDMNQGRMLGMFVIGLDITDRRRAEQELAERDQRLKLLIDSVSDYAIYMLDPQGRVATWNAGAERNKGYTQAQVLGQHFSLFFKLEDRAAGKPEEELRQAAREGRFESEDWRVRADGSTFWASILLRAIHGDDGQLIGYAKIVRDLTERRHQQMQLERVVELAPCAMLMVDKERRITMVNAQAESTFGYSRDALLGQPIEKLIAPHWQDKHPTLLAELMQGTTPRTIGAGRDLRALRSDGQEILVEIGLSPIDTADGPVMVAAIVDITERRRQQAATERALADKETLLKEVYHRVKNNLQVIQSLLSLQRRTVAAGPAHNAIDDTIQRVAAMALVHEKLYRSSNLSALSLPDYTRDLLVQLTAATGANQRGVTVHADIAPLDIGLDSAVPFGLLLTELVSNSLKHAFPEQRPGHVWVSLAAAEGGALLNVRDDGIGLSPQAAKAKRGSMGLQLAEALASQLGGELRVDDTSGGASFSVRLGEL